MITSEQKARAAVKAAKAKWGHGWALLSEEQRAGAVALQIVALLMVQDEESAPPALRRLQEVAGKALADVTGDVFTI